MQVYLCMLLSTNVVFRCVMNYTIGNTKSANKEPEAISLTLEIELDDHRIIQHSALNAYVSLLLLPLFIIIIIIIISLSILIILICKEVLNIFTLKKFR